MKEKLYFFIFYTVTESFELYLGNYSLRFDKYYNKNFIHQQPKFTEL